MNWVCSVAAVMVAVAVVFRLLWWARERSHQLAGQRQGSAENPEGLSQAGHLAEATGNGLAKVETKDQRR